jgi:hypothetical protein
MQRSYDVISTSLARFDYQIIDIVEVMSANKIAYHGRPHCPKQQFGPKPDCALRSLSRRSRTRRSSLLAHAILLACLHDGIPKPTGRRNQIENRAADQRSSCMRLGTMFTRRSPAGDSGRQVTHQGRGAADRCQHCQTAGVAKAISSSRIVASDCFVWSCRLQAFCRVKFFQVGK